MNELVKSVLVLVVAFALRAVLNALGVSLDEATFNTIVTAIVALIVGEGVHARLAARYPALK